MKKVIIVILLILVALGLLIGVLFYFFQEKVIFYPDKLPKDHKFKFKNRFEEINIATPDGKNLNALLFKAENPQGLLFYLHGNGGALDSWGDISRLYTNMGYDIFMLDYRGFGKSTGSITSEEQMHEDVQLAYDKMKELYDEDHITVIGFSIGTGMASCLAAKNNPQRLILQAPYYSLEKLIQDISPIVPAFLIRYKLENYTYLPQCRMPVTIFHGNDDKVINIASSLKLKELLKPTDELVILEDTEHNEITANKDYQEKLREILQVEEKTYIFEE